MPAQLIACACGRKLRVDERHFGKTVRCPACHQTFTAPTPTEEDIPMVLPADPTHSDDEGTEEIVAAPQPRRAPRSVPPPAEEEIGADEDGEAVENEEPRPRKKKRRPRPAGARGFFISLSSHLQSETAFRILLVALVGGVGLLMVAFVEGRLMGAASDKPQTLTLAQLAAHGPGNNAHVIITYFVPCENFVYEYKGVQSNWQRVYVPVMPLTPDMQARLGAGPMGKQTIPAGSIRVIVQSSNVHSEADMAKIFDKPTIQGTVVNSILSLDSKAQKLLRDSYPGTDFESCYILQEGRKPSSAAFVILMAVGGTLLTVISGLLFAARYLFRNEV